MSCRQLYFNNEIKVFILKQPHHALFLRGAKAPAGLWGYGLSTGECSLFREVGVINLFAVGGYAGNIPLQCWLSVAGRADCH